mgnify:CR=1 FL=1
MTKIVGIRFRNVGKIYYFDPKNYKMQVGDHVIVETARGVEFGRVVLGPKEVGEDEVVHPLKEVLRVATQADEDREKQNRLKEKDAFKICQKKIREHGLEMKLIDAEYTFDNNKVLFYFTADGRIDFRQLVKDLAAIFKTRIELRQIGVRDETKILGGIGICGRCLCCHTYLSEFAPVSIKMAKEQNLSLNPTKISGLCDRLMCCLKYEQDNYEQTRKRMPRVGREIITPDGVGVINAINVLEETVRVRIAVGDSFELREYPIDDCQRPEREERKPRVEEEDPAVEDEQSAPQGERVEPAAQPAPQRKFEQRPPRAPRGDRPERPQRPERGPRPERPPRPERGPRPPRKPMDRPEQPVKPEAPKQAEQSVRQPEQPPVVEQKAVEAVDVLEIREDAKREDLF